MFLPLLLPEPLFLRSVVVPSLPLPLSQATVTSRCITQTGTLEDLSLAFLLFCLLPISVSRQGGILSLLITNLKNSPFALLVRNNSCWASLATRYLFICLLVRASILSSNYPPVHPLIHMSIHFYFCIYPSLSFCLSHFLLSPSPDTHLSRKLLDVFVHVISFINVNSFNPYTSL